jgi:hypothetical protein
MQKLQVQRDKDLYGFCGRTYPGYNFALRAFCKQRIIQIIYGMTDRFQRPALFTADCASRMTLGWKLKICRVGNFTMCRPCRHLFLPHLLKTKECRIPKQKGSYESLFDPKWNDFPK